jgi:protein deglycase
MVAVFLADGFEEIEAITVYDILKRAEIDIRSVGLGSKTIRGAHGIKIVADMEIGELGSSDPDMIILPGGMPGTRNLDESAELRKIIKKAYEDGRRIAAICAAPLIPGKLDMLKDKEAVCFPGFEKYLKGARLSRKAVVTDGNITTSRGPGTAFAFSLELVRILRGGETAVRLAADMQYGEK